MSPLLIYFVLFSFPFAILIECLLLSLSSRSLVYIFIFVFSDLLLVSTSVFFTSVAAAKSLQSCPTLCDPIDGSPSGSPVPGILQARTLEWVAISFSNAGK